MIDVESIATASNAEAAVNRPIHEPAHQTTPIHNMHLSKSLSNVTSCCHLSILQMTAPCMSSHHINQQTWSTLRSKKVKMQQQWIQQQLNVEHKRSPYFQPPSQIHPNPRPSLDPNNPLCPILLAGKNNTSRAKNPCTHCLSRNASPRGVHLLAWRGAEIHLPIP